ncbi:MAG: hypothetical protein RLZZ283_256 [Candidatus Parcubacteria bacterium]
MDWGSRVTYLATTALKERVTPFGIKDKDRKHHVCVLGRVGSGRAEFLTRMAIQDIERGIGMVIIDAAGNMGPMLMERLNPEEIERLVYLDASDAEYPFSWNVAEEFRGSARGKELFEMALASIYRTKKNELTDAIASHIYKDKEKSIIDAYALVTDEKVRKEAFPEDADTSVKFYNAFEKETDTISDMEEHGRYLAKDTMVRNLIGQIETKISLGELARGAIVIVDVSRIRIFPTRITPVVRLFTYAARARAAELDVPVSLYFHDCLRYLSETDSESLFTDRSVSLSLSDTIYHESDLPLREKALARCGSVIAFQPHPIDLPMVEKVFYPYVTPEELSGLDQGESCVALTIDAVRTQPFFADVLPLSERTNVSLQDLIGDSRAKYTMPRTQVDASFRDRAQKTNPPPPPATPGTPSTGGGSGFSDAFRAIFQKPAGDAAPATTEAKPAVPPTPVPPEKPEEPSEVAEDVLKRLLYVGPLPA